MVSMLMAFVASPWMVAEMTSEGFNLPLSPGLMALMPVVIAVVFALSKVPAIEKNKKLLLPILSVLVSVGAAFLTGQAEPVMAGLGLGVATCYSYDLGRGAVVAILPKKVKPLA